jgi:L-lactate dehydrogenase (cytochrome)
MGAWILSGRLDSCHSIDDLRRLAARRLPRALFDYLDGGAETEETARRNIAAFDDMGLLPRSLVDVSRVSTATSILGQSVAWPLLCSPTGASRLYHRAGEVAVARAAEQAGLFYSLSTMATTSLEDVAAASTGPKLFQLCIFRDRGITRELVERCRQAGFHALCITVDAAVRGKRERELRAGMGVPMNLSLSSLAGMLMRPAWLAGNLRGGGLSMPNFASHAGSAELPAQTRFIASELDASVTWQDVGELIELWKGPFAIKGIMSAEDARRAADIGATAVMVSNHGGRQLDGAAAAFEALPAIADAVGDRLEVILDGGIRRGVHVVKALARGAKACSVGRAYLFGLSAAGEAGVGRALAILQSEFVRSMQLCGFADLESIRGADFVSQRD